MSSTGRLPPFRSPLRGPWRLAPVRSPAQGEATHLAATGLDQQPSLGRRLLLVAAMFGSSAVVYAVRRGRSPHREQQVVDGEGQ